MKKVFVFLLFLLLASGIVGYVYVNRAYTSELTVLTVPTQKLSSTPKAPIVAQPTKLLIPKLSVAAKIESVGLDDKKNMDVPKMAENVGWYNLGVKPGERGNAVFAGHFDTETGAPAVFYNLTELIVGDEIQAIDEQGTTYTYKVSAIQTYPTDEFPLQEVFGTTDSSRLNLITCSGQFNSSQKNYSHRTVVYSELVDTQTE